MKRSARTGIKKTAVSKDTNKANKTVAAIGRNIFPSIPCKDFDFRIEVELQSLLYLARRHSQQVATIIADFVVNLGRDSEGYPIRSVVIFQDITKKSDLKTSFLKFS